MTARQLLVELERLGVVLTPEGIGIRIKAPSGAISRRMREQLAAQKSEVLRLIRARPRKGVSLATAKLKDHAIRIWPELVGEDVWLVAEDEDAHCLGEPRGRVYTLAEARVLAGARRSRQVLEVHNWKKTLDAVLTEGQFEISGERISTIQATKASQLRLWGLQAEGRKG